MRFIHAHIPFFFLYRTGRRKILSHYCPLPEGGTQRAESLNAWMVINSSTNDRRSDLTETSRLVTGHSASGKSFCHAVSPQHTIPCYTPRCYGNPNETFQWTIWIGKFDNTPFQARKLKKEKREKLNKITAETSSHLVDSNV